MTGRPSGGHNSRCSCSVRLIIKCAPYPFSVAQSQCGGRAGARGCGVDPLRYRQSSKCEKFTLPLCAPMVNKPHRTPAQTAPAAQTTLASILCLSVWHTLAQLLLVLSPYICRLDRIASFIFFLFSLSLSPLKHNG